MGFILFLLLIFGMAILRLDKIYGEQKEKIEVDVFFRENAKMSKMQQIEKEISLDHRVNSTIYIPKEKAVEFMIEGMGEEFLDEFLGGNPLYNSINLTLKKDYAQIDSVQLFEQNILEKYEDYVSEISYSKAQFQTINDTFYNGLWYALGLSSILLIIAVILINNTIRLAIFSKRFLIRTMQFVGAKHSFIKKPFLTISLNDLSIPLAKDSSESKKDLAYISQGILYNYAQEKENLLLNEGEIITKFIREKKLTFIVTHKTVILPKEILVLIDKKITDKKSGQEFLILKK